MALSAVSDKTVRRDAAPLVVRAGLRAAKVPEVKQPLMGLQRRAESVKDDVKDAVVKALPQGVPTPGELQSRGVSEKSK
jgi:hypothetical protein